MSRTRLGAARAQLGRLRARRPAQRRAALAAAPGARADTTATPATAAETGDPVLPGLTSEQTWRLPDALVTKLEDSWNERRGIYLDRGNISIRANAMLMEIHALAALAGHEGASRQDARLPSLVRFFTHARRVRHEDRDQARDRELPPHARVGERVPRRLDAGRPSPLPPMRSSARALATAWRARDGRRPARRGRARIQQVIGAVARGKFYAAPNRAENQINWNTDVYGRDARGERRPLPAPRLPRAPQVFIDHAFTPAYRGGSSNLSRATVSATSRIGRRQREQDGDPSSNENLVHSALGFYNTAVNAG